MSVLLYESANPFDIDPDGPHLSPIDRKNKQKLDYCVPCEQKKEKEKNEKRGPSN